MSTVEEISLDPCFKSEHWNEEFRCTLCGDDELLQDSFAHSCMTYFSKNPKKQFLVVYRDHEREEKKVRLLFAMPDATNVVYKNDKTGGLSYAKARDLQGIKRLFNLQTAEKSSSISSYEISQTAPTTETASSNSEVLRQEPVNQYNCSVCWEQCTFEEASVHGCITANTDDPQKRFVLLLDFCRVCPIIHNGTKILFTEFVENNGQSIRQFLHQSLEEFSLDRLKFGKIAVTAPVNPDVSCPSVKENEAPNKQKDSEKSKKKGPAAGAVNFSREEDLKLLSLIEKRDALWNYLLPMAQRDEATKNRLWTEIFEQFKGKQGLTIKHVKDRWKNIQTARAQKISLNKKRLVSGASRQPTSDYIYEDAMAFLKNISLDRQKTTTNIQPLIQPNQNTSNSSSADDVLPSVAFDNVPDDNELNNSTDDVNDNRPKPTCPRNKKTSTVDNMAQLITQSLAAPIKINIEAPTKESFATPIKRKEDQIIDVWCASMASKLNRLTPKKRLRKMDEMEKDLILYIGSLDEN